MEKSFSISFALGPLHTELGWPIEKLVLGMPFYGGTRRGESIACALGLESQDHWELG